MIRVEIYCHNKFPMFKHKHVYIGGNNEKTRDISRDFYNLGNAAKTASTSIKSRCTLNNKHVKMLSYYVVPLTIFNKKYINIFDEELWKGYSFR